MKLFADKVAVITGGGSGIGRALAIALSKEGAKIVLADIDEGGMAGTAKSLATENMAVRCDVGKPEQLQGLAEQTYKRFGAAHLVFNNAGVAVAGPTWTATLEDWKWSLDINLMGVVHGIRAFVPRMLAAKTEGHIVNTASVAGLLSLHGSGVYCATKHAVVTLSECLYQDLRAANAAIDVSVLCPAYVKTGIAESARNRPKELAATNPLAAPYVEAVRKALEHGKLSAEDVARITLEGMKAGRFYILPHTKIKLAIEARMKDILEDRLPTDVSFKG